MTHDTREGWLRDAIARLTPLIEGADATLRVPPIHVSFGFPSRAPLKVIGQCWEGTASADGEPHIFVSPTLVESDPARILGVLLHEMCHAVLPKAKHGKKFQKLADGVGLTPPWTATGESEALGVRLNAIAELLGPLPHSKLTLTTHKKQTTRMVKCSCPVCGYVVRTTAKWLAEEGAPHCGDLTHGRMERDDGEGE